jgi:hypothetical protein
VIDPRLRPDKLMFVTHLLSRSAVMTVVNPCCLSQPNSRRISARRIPGFGNPPNSASRVQEQLLVATASSLRSDAACRGASDLDRASAQRVNVALT